MKKFIFIVLPVFFIAACAEEQQPPPPPGKPPVKRTTKAKSDNPEDFRAVEKPSTYTH